MTALARRPRPRHRRCRARSARRSSTSSSTPASAQVGVLDNLVRGRRGEPRRRAGRSGAVDARRGRHPRPRPRARPDPRHATSSSTRPRSGSPSAPRSRGWPSRCSSTAPSTSSRPPPQHGVDKVVAASSASVYGLAEEFPTTERHHPYDNDTFYGAAKIVQRGHAAQLPGDVRPRLRRPALLQRLRPADGRARPLHRGARPLDGADRRRPAAADLRRRPADDGLRLHRPTSPGPTSWPPSRDVAEGVYNVASGERDQPARAGRGAAAGDGLRPAASSTGPSARVNGVVRRLADTARRRARPRLRGRRPASRRACAQLVEWWRPQREEIAAGPAVRRAAERR